MSALELVLPLWALAATLFSAVALARLLKRRPAPALAPAPPLLLLRPLDAPTPAELRALATPVHYAGAIEQVVLSPTRPPLPEGVRWLRSDPLTPNRKVGHLLHGLACVPLRGRVVLSIDADVAVTGALLQALALPVLSLIHI